MVEVILAAAKQAQESSADGAVVVGITGIVVSGVIGPTVAYFLGKRVRLTDFERGQAVERRAELRKVLDEAAGLLASAGRHLRVLTDPASGRSERKVADTWAREVFPISQRLQLWLQSEHPVVAAYDQVRDRLIEMASLRQSPSEEDWQRLEDERRRFLDTARQTLLTPTTKTDVVA